MPGRSGTSWSTPTVRCARAARAAASRSSARRRRSSNGRSERGCSGRGTRPPTRASRACATVRARGDEGAVRVLETAAGHLSRAISVLTNMLDVDRVVLGGPSWSRLESVYLRVLPGLLAAQSATAAMRTLPVTGAVAGEDVAAVGAACLVLDAVHSPHAATLYLPAGDPA
ncbi:ROK family protein [Microbacterium resistens]|uniref:ROK family protein n=1 Tax=Microbacterium resistens TaxID=156977 RepID=UPI0027E23847|nr:ROK family protein [Microbacterium resistens]